MERTEDLLREEFRRAGGVRPPEREAMLARVARVRRRRRAAMVGAAVIGISAVAASAVLAVPNLRGGQRAGADLPDRLYSNELVNVVFTDTTHGYAVQERCSQDLMTEEVPDGAPTPDVHSVCASHLVATSDGGQSWQQRTLPAEPATKDAGYDLVMGHSLMLWRDTPGTIALGSWHRRYWTSADGGLTWQESATLRPVGPAGSLAWFGPHDELSFLATAPPLGYSADGNKYRTGAKNPISAATDGSYWLACIDDPCVQVTRDQGQTWQTPTPVPAATSVDWVTSYDGQHVYAAVRTGSGPALVRSNDGGTTWAPVAGVTGLPEHGVDGLALANGDLVMTGGGEVGGTYLLRAGTTAVLPVPAAPSHVPALYQTGGVIVAAQVWQQGEQPELDPSVTISTDNGTTWRTIPVPLA